MKPVNSVNHEKTRRAQDKLLQYIRDDWKIFIDTSSFLYENSYIFFPHLIELLVKHQSKVFVAFRVIEEIKKKSSDDKLKTLAFRALAFIEEMQAIGVVDIRGDANDNFADNVFQVVFTKFRIAYKLVLITQDVNLAKDINNLNSISSVKGQPIHVHKISQYGFLGSFFFDSTQKNTQLSEKKPKQVKPKNDVIDKFKLSSKIILINDKHLNPSFIPVTGDKVSGTGNVEVELRARISEGGEGIIYETDTPYVAKIYKKEKNTLLRYEKIQLMTSKRLSYEGICYPIDILFNKNKEFIGYLMPKAEGKTLQRSFFIPPLLKKNFPNWKKIDAVNLCITILEKLKYLHDRNIILGDINPENILIVSPRQVYFVDTDSYQLEGFPCPVGTINYTAPELQSKGDYSKYLRTFGNENFAVATLLFMIMLPGKPPYSQQGGGTPQKNISNMDFSYPFEENSNKKTSDGPWRYIWSHLTYELKKSFYHTFQKEGDYSQEKERLNVNQWLVIFKKYESLLSSGKLKEQDSMSEDLFPTRHKKHPNATYITCGLCNTEVNKEHTKSGICNACLRISEVYHCKNCGKDITYSNLDRYIRKLKKSDICRSCENALYYEGVCTDCNQSFNLGKKEYDYFTKKKLQIPKRCQKCRNDKKAQPSASVKISTNSSSNGSNNFLSSLFKIFS